jgi:tetratricopeptide (TPR) repeat protein
MCGDLWSAREHNRSTAVHFECAGARELIAITNAHLGLSYFQLGLFDEAGQLLERVLATPDAGNLALMYGKYYKCLLLFENGAYDQTLALVDGLAKEALATNDFVIFWCARLLMANLWAHSDKLSDADAVLDELGEGNAFLPFLRARLLSIRSEIRRRQGNAEDAVRLAAESITSSIPGPRYNYGEDPAPLRHALALYDLGNKDVARRAIRDARDDLFARAAQIPDENIRRGYFENIGWHAQTLTLAKEWLDSQSVEMIDSTMPSLAPQRYPLP